MTASLAESAILISIYKPILFGAVVGIWAWLASYLEKDADHHTLGRTMWNLVFIAVGVITILLWLLIPLFWIGLILAFVLIGGMVGGYHFYRNANTPAHVHWTLSLDSFRQSWDESQKKRVERSVAVRIVGADGETVQVPAGEDPLAPMYEAMENILEFALPRRAERIDVLAMKEQTVVAVQIDGVKYPQTKLDGTIGVSMIDFLKTHAGMDVSDRRKKQTGEVRIVHDIPHTLRLTSSGTTRGLNLTMEVDPVAFHSISFEELGMLESQREQLETIFDTNTGAVIVVCPPHQGMTTTMYSMVARHDPYMSNISSLEKEIEFELEGVTHQLANTGADAPSIARQLESLMLREPNVILMSHLTEPETAKVIAQFGPEHRFYLGLRQKDTFTALKAWLHAVGDKAMAGQSLTAIVAIRLLRKLCPTCRIPYKPDPGLLKKLNLPADQVAQLYKHSGKVLVKDREMPCETCVGLGYLGRRAVFEVMIFDDEARGMVADGHLDRLKNHLRRNRMLYMQEAALSLAAQGVTSVSEISRVLASDK